MADKIEEALIEQLALALEKRPETPLYATVDPLTWLQQAWSEPVRAHTPMWTMVIDGKVSPRDLVALMLYIWGTADIKHPPRYLSWLTQRWLSLPHIPPVQQWAKWQNLAEMPIGKWFDEGRRCWNELAAREKRRLPFGLDALEYEYATTYSGEALQIRGTPSSQNELVSMDLDNLDLTAEETSNGLEICPGNGRLSIRDIWHAILGQLSVQLNQSTYICWVEGAHAVSYAEGVLTVKARHPGARDWLEFRLNHAIEQIASSLAAVPIKICYTADP